MAHPQEQPRPTYPATYQPLAPSPSQVPGSFQFQGPATPPGPEQVPVEKDPYAPVVWGNLEDFTCPSGQRCALRPVDLGSLLTTGLLEKINALTGVVEADLIRPAQGLPPINVEKILEDPSRTAELLTIIDKVVAGVVARPSLLPSYDAEGFITEDCREMGRVYVDSVPLRDRIAIFHKSLQGLEELKSFRAGSVQPGSSVADQQGYQQSAQ